MLKMDDIDESRKETSLALALANISEDTNEKENSTDHENNS